MKSKQETDEKTLFKAIFILTFLIKRVLLLTRHALI